MKIPWSDFPMGAIVRLKSGGPRMMLAHRTDEICYCEWFDESGNACMGRFQLESLEAEGVYDPNLKEPPKEVMDAIHLIENWALENGHRKSRIGAVTIDL